MNIPRSQYDPRIKDVMKMYDQHVRMYHNDLSEYTLDWQVVEMYVEATGETITQLVPVARMYFK